MDLTVDQGDSELLALLYFRDLHSLRVGASIPKSLEVQVQAGSEPLLDPVAVSALWESAWSDRVKTIVAFDQYDLSGDGLDGYFDAARRFVEALPTPWRERFPASFVGDDFDVWCDDVGPSLTGRIRTRSYEAVEAACGSGLAHVVLLPLSVRYVRWLSPVRLMVSSSTWNDDEQLPEVLSALSR